MDYVITPIGLYILLVVLAVILGGVFDPVYLWIFALAFGALFSSSELSIHIDAKRIIISYLPPGSATSEKGGV